jgi:hypothetical protein
VCRNYEERQHVFVFITSDAAPAALVVPVGHNAWALSSLVVEFTELRIPRAK